MQGGCVCENCSYLRVGTGNVEIAGLFAPKPLGMTGANDWTIDIETKGLPELKAALQALRRRGQRHGQVLPEFGHNYNQVSREFMYNWFNKHLKLGLAEPVVEKPFKPVPPRNFPFTTQEHPRPEGLLSRRRAAAVSERDFRQADRRAVAQGRSRPGGVSPCVWHRMVIINDYIFIHIYTKYRGLYLLSQEIDTN